MHCEGNRVLLMAGILLILLQKIQQSILPWRNSPNNIAVRRIFRQKHKKFYFLWFWHESGLVANALVILCMCSEQGEILFIIVLFNEWRELIAVAHMRVMVLELLNEAPWVHIRSPSVQRENPLRLETENMWRCVFEPNFLLIKASIFNSSLSSDVAL